MSLKSWLTKTLIDQGVLKSAFTPGQLSGSYSDPFAIWRGGRKIDPSVAMNEYRGWAYAAARAIAEVMASIDFELYEQKKGGVEKIPDHEILDVLYGANPYQTGYELRFNMAINLIMAGNAYILLDGVENATQKPKALYLLPTQQVKVIKGKFPELIKGYIFRNGPDSTPYAPHQILHLRLPDPSDPVEGIGVVQAIAEWISLDNQATTVNAAFFRNGARIGGFLESENATTPEQLKYLKESFDEIYRGADAAYKIAALPKGAKFTEGQVGPKDIDYSEGSRVFRDRILAGFRVPKTILGAAESETNRATAETAEYVFANRTIKPLMELLVTQLNEFFVPRYSDKVFLSYQDPVPVDRAQLMTEITGAMGSQPYISHNEAREKQFGLPPITNGDSVMGNAIQYQPIGSVIKKHSDYQSTKSDKNGLKTRSSINYKRKQDISSLIAEKAVELAQENEKQIKEAKALAQKSILTMNDDQYEGIWKGMVGRVEPFEKRMADIVKKFNEKQVDEVLKNVKDETKAIKKTDLFDEKEWVNIMVNMTSPLISQLYIQEHKEATELIGFDDVTGLTPEAKKALEHGMELMARSYNETTLTILAEKIARGLDEGMGFVELRNEITDIYEFSSTVRAGQVARSEVFRAANYATKQAWRDTGVVKTIKWYTAADERVCDFCDPMHGKVIDIEDNFFEKGDSATGSNGKTLDLDYSDVGAPPLHASCRCYTRPETIEIKTITKKEVEPKEKPIEAKKEDSIDLAAIDKKLDEILNDD